MMQGPSGDPTAARSFSGETAIAIRPEFAFDIAWDVYQSLKAEQAGISSLDVQQSSDHCWRPRNGAGADEYMADFALAVRAAFKDPHDSSRRILAELFYIGLADYAKARHLIGISEWMWGEWADEIRKRAGSEIMRRGLFPPKHYFGQRTRPRKAPSHGAKHPASESAAQTLR